MKPLFFLLLLYLPACGDGYLQDDPQDATRLEGAVWEQQGAVGTRLYHISGGMLTARAIGFGMVLSQREYAYHIQRDTIYLTDILTETPDKWAVLMRSDTEAEITAGAGTGSPVFFMVKRY